MNYSAAKKMITETNKRKIKIILAVAALLIILVIGYYINTKFDQEKPQSSNTLEMTPGIFAMNSNVANISFMKWDEGYKVMEAEDIAKTVFPKT
jgi:glucose uptake protein GlcU